MSRAAELRKQSLQFADTMEQLLIWRPEIEEAIARTTGTHAFDDIVNMVANGSLITKFLGDAFALITIAEFPLTKNYHIFIAGGNMDTLIATASAFNKHAAALGCQRITISGRPGWSRALKKVGATHANTVMYLEVDDHGLTERRHTNATDRPAAGKAGNGSGVDDDAVHGQEPMGHGIDRTATGCYE